MTARTLVPTDTSGNPAFNERVLSHYTVAPRERVPTMTSGGVAVKTLVNLMVLGGTLRVRNAAVLRRINERLAELRRRNGRS